MQMKNRAREDKSLIVGKSHVWVTEYDSSSDDEISVPKDLCLMARIGSDNSSFKDDMEESTKDG